MDGAVALCIHGDSLWHRLGLSALGIGWEERGGFARRTADASPVFLGAMTLTRETSAEQLDAAVSGLHGAVHVCDSFDVLDMERLGWRRAWTHPWMLREPGPVFAAHRDGLRVAAVRTAEEVQVFERTVFEAADGRPDSLPAGSVHPAPESLGVPGLTLFVAWLDGVPVGTSLAAVDERVVQVSAVAVLPRARRRGIGAALTAAAVAVAPDRPAVLDSTSFGHGVYLGLGFRDVGSNSIWRRDPR
ncbi:MAG TPA: GNAT family N-acetyltransferase [Candidatus Dormibacteraeota bacterium]|nr:GNAT family N-acetyltransferase [Candidatus Dormibacteraeota bacterium]